MSQSIISKLLGTDENIKLLTSKVESLEASAIEASTLNATLTGNVKTLTETITGKDNELVEKLAKIAELESAIAEFKSTETLAAEKAVQIVASAGVPAVSITVAEATPSTPKELNEKLNSITDLHERAAFFKANKNKFLS